MIRVASVVLVLALTVPAYGELKIRVKRSYYPVTGITETAIRQSLAKDSPVWNDDTNKPDDAESRWTVYWEFKHYFSRAVCRLKAVRVIVEVKWVLPRWEHYWQAEETLRRRWKSYYRALMDHHRGHEGIGVRAGREVDALLTSLALEEPCTGVVIKANRKANKIIDRYLSEERRYDRDSNYGVREGAVFGGGAGL